MSFDERPPFSFADQPAADGRATVRPASLLDLLPVDDATDLGGVMAAPAPTAPSHPDADVPRGPAP